MSLEKYQVIREKKIYKKSECLSEKKRLKLYLIVKALSCGNSLYYCKKERTDFLLHTTVSMCWVI